MIKYVIWLSLFIVALPGCATQAQQFAPIVKRALSGYCTANQIARAQIRLDWNEQLDPYKIHVTCPGD